MRCVLAVLSLAAASVASAAGPRVEIVIGEKAPALERRAAEELAGDLKRLYQADVHLAAEAPANAANLILVGSPDTNGAIKSLGDRWPKLSEQGHVVRSVKVNDRPALLVGGGSPAATFWAAAELAHQWGIRAMLYGDVDPVAPPEFSIEDFDIVMEPRAKIRAWMMDFDSPIGPATWSLANQKKLLRQLARLKFNSLILNTSGKTPAAVLAAFDRIPVSGDTAGRSAFGGAKHFENPDLAAADSDAARQKAGEELIRGFEREASALGMSFHKKQAIDQAERALNGGLLPMVYMGHERFAEDLKRKRNAIGIEPARLSDGDLWAFLHSRNFFDAKFTGGHPIHDLVTPICGDGVSDRVLKAFELAEEATKLINAGDKALSAPRPDVIMKHYASTDPPPEWWGKARDNYLNAMNEMYRANTRAREGGRSYTLYFARRFEFAFEYMNCLEAVRKAGNAKSKGDQETQIAELEKAVESMNGALNAMAAVARSQSDRGIIAVLNEYGYRPLVKELDAASGSQ
ncbi:MAG TPA: hypothetical protein VMP01_18025 [Pirellulaceae bacterium]|nr:hypothetical protein [Pirellulaceae bacterium]